MYKLGAVSCQVYNLTARRLNSPGGCKQFPLVKSKTGKKQFILREENHGTVSHDRFNN